MERHLMERPPMERPPYYTASTLAGAMAAGDVAELKANGRWVTVVIAAGQAVLWSRKRPGRQSNPSRPIPVPWTGTATLLAEYMVGRRYCRKGDPLHGTIAVHDCLDCGPVNLRPLPQRDRRKAAAALVAVLGEPFALIPQCRCADVTAATLEAAAEQTDAEGYVIKRSWAPFDQSFWVRWKRY